MNTIRETIEKYGSPEEKEELEYLSLRIENMSEEEQIAFLRKREEHYESKMDNIYCSDSQAQVYADKQYVSTRMLSVLEKRSKKNNAGAEL